MSRRFMKLLTVLVTGAAIVPLLTFGTAHAIPAFARSVKTECSTCHTIYPELTEAGANFKKNGFVWGHKSDRSEPNESKTEKEYLTVASIPEFIPLSISATLNASYDDRRGKDYGKSADKFDFNARAIKLLAGGNLGEYVGFWLSYNLYTSKDTVASFNPNVTENNLPDLVEAYAVGRKLFGSPVNFKVGRFQPGVSLWEKNDKSTVAEYATTHGNAGDSAFALDAPGDGAELNAIIHPRIFVTAGGIKRKNVSNGDGYISARYRIKGTDFNNNDVDPDLENDSFTNYLSATVGGFGYVGTNLVGTGKQSNHFYRAGGEGDVSYKRLRTKFAAVFGEDKNSIIDQASPSDPIGPHIMNQSRTYSVEASYLLSKKFLPTFRFELGEQHFAGSNPVTRNYITAISYAPLENIKFVGEVKISDSSQRTDDLYNLALVGAF